MLHIFSITGTSYHLQKAGTFYHSSFSSYAVDRVTDNKAKPYSSVFGKRGKNVTGEYKLFGPLRNLKNSFIYIQKRSR